MSKEQEQQQLFERYSALYKNPIRQLASQLEEQTFASFNDLISKAIQAQQTIQAIQNQPCKHCGKSVNTGPTPPQESKISPPQENKKKA